MPSSSFNTTTYSIFIITSFFFVVLINSSQDDIMTSTKLFTDVSVTLPASQDFGKLTEASPAAAVFRPSSADDIVSLVSLSYLSSEPFKIAARGHGHSLRGQATAPNGVVVDMRTLGGEDDGGRIVVFPGEMFVDVGGEQLWIDVLLETLKHGIAPRSWTDYLYLTVGGTLSNAGVSGQAFLHGPQISNVFELDVVTGKGEKITCSENANSDLFFAVLGGLGQFGIITRARIAVEAAPDRVRWVRLIYTDFVEFTKDQERLISMDQGKEKKGFQYVEGSLLMDQGLISNWRSSFFSGRDLVRIGALAAEHSHIYCLEGSMNYNLAEESSVQQELESVIKELNFVKGFAFTNDVSYLDFLNRVHDGELKLRAKGLWDVPHPWLNIFVPKSRISDINEGVFKGILKNNDSMGPILIYPMNKNKWDDRMSAVIPDEEVFYSIGLLRSAIRDLQYLEDQNMEILNFCDKTGIKFKQYLPHYTSQDDWKKHFGSTKWDTFAKMKLKYDPRAILAPGQGIFTSSLVDHVSE